MLNKRDLRILSQIGKSETMYIAEFKKFPFTQQIRSESTLQEILDTFSDFKVYSYSGPCAEDYSEDIFVYYLLIHRKHKIMIEMYSQNGSDFILKIFYDRVLSNTISNKLKVLKASKEDNINLIYTIVNSQRGLILNPIEYDRKKIDIEGNYNDNFYKVNKEIKQILSEKRAGIHIFYGIPGTGKSSYIKYLINEIDKKFIYCPSYLVPQLSDPNFISLIAKDGKDCIMVIEDAEEVLSTDGSGRNSAIANILNISDGILGDALNIQIIATFNTEFNNLDPAILRKGRLLSMYEFNKLDISKAQKILESLGINETIKEPMTLADIYNYANKDWYIKETKRIGL